MNQDCNQRQMEGGKRREQEEVKEKGQKEGRNQIKLNREEKHGLTRSLPRPPPSLLSSPLSLSSLHQRSRLSILSYRSIEQLQAGWKELKTGRTEDKKKRGKTRTRERKRTEGKKRRETSSLFVGVFVLFTLKLQIWSKMRLRDKKSK